MFFKNKLLVFLTTFLIYMTLQPILNERFVTNDTESNVIFVNIPEAVQIFDSSLDYSLMQNNEIFSRTNGEIGLGLTREERIRKLKNMYHSKLIEFSQEEKNAIVTMCNGINIKNVKWKFIKINNGIDWNYPYTLANCIVLPAVKVSSIKNAIESNDKTLIASHVNTFVHEYMHVLQRKYQPLFNKFYIEKWHFTRANTMINDLWVKKYWITNPDVNDELWVYDLNQFNVNKNPEYIWPMFLIDPKNLRNHVKLAIKVKEEGNNNFSVITSNSNGIPVYDDLLNIKSYNERFYNLRQLYHPNEIFANFVADSHNLKYMYPNDYKEIYELLNSILN